VNEAALRTLIRARLRARLESEKKQIPLLDNNDDFAETIRVKLKGLCETQQFYNFSRCGHEQIYRTCQNCGKWETFDYRCNLKWCPRCQNRLAHIRRNLIQLWAKRIKQPKHLILTHKNFPILTHKKIREHTAKLAKLRRSKCFKEVKGGCVSTEITNEERGWHLHAHLLLDVRWLEMPEVSKTWGKLVGQNFAIVKVKDVRQADYLHEICKYVVEGSELAKWHPEHLNEFVQAVRGLRFFNSFGSLRDLAPQIRRELFAQKPDSPVCKCGCGEFIFQTEEQIAVADARRLAGNKRSRARRQKPPEVLPPVAAATGGKLLLL
jgi:Replication protein